MQDGSFAIMPDKDTRETEKKYKKIGALISYTFEDSGTLELKCQYGYVSIMFYRNDIVRIIMNPKKRPTKKSTLAVVKEKEKVELSFKESEEKICVLSSKILISINKAPLLISVYDQNNQLIVDESKLGMASNNKKEVICYKDMDPNDHYYGFGEKTSFLDKRGEKMTMWNTDVYSPHNPGIDELYVSIPYFMTIRKGNAYGIFLDNASKSVFDMKNSTEFYSFKAEMGQLDYYIFAGPTPKDVIEQYTDLTGRMPLPPKWALGYHQSRYSYKSEHEVRELVKKFKEKEIPLDAIYLDIHYMDGYRIFTFNKDLFPFPNKLIQELRSEGIRVVPIVDPGIKADPDYKIYQEGIDQNHFCKYIDKSIYHGNVWPGKSAFPDFTNRKTRKWWGENHKFYTDLGIEGIWNDMNEPAVFNETKTMDVKVMHDNGGEPKTHRELHNLYGFLMGKSTYEGVKNQLNGLRPFLLTRSGYSGIQRYSAVWTGDNRSFWEHLQMALPMCMNLGVSGIPFCGPDVGGFAHDTNGELLARWTQLGTFTPFFRNHSELNSIRQEPWSFGEKYESVIRKYIRKRYIWLPYLYTLFKEASDTGMPVMRPLVLEYPDDENTYNLSDQFMVGSEIIIAPILSPNTYHRVVYLPEGKWINYWNDEIIKGNKHVLVEADLETLPIFVKEGAIITQGTTKRSTEIEESQLTIHIYPSRAEISEFTYYEDDGKTFSYKNGDFFSCVFKTKIENSTLAITIDSINVKYKPEWKKAIFVIHNASDDIQVEINGNKQSNTEILKNSRIQTSVNIWDYIK